MQILLLLSNFAGFIIANAPILVGFIIPPFVELLNKEVKDEKEKFIVTLLACMAAAVVLHINQLKVGNLGEALQALSIIFIESQVVFKLYFKSSYFREKIVAKLEGKPELVIPKRVTS